MVFGRWAALCLQPQLYSRKVQLLVEHFVRKCECGKIIAQCRCIGDRIVITASPCSHYVVANSLCYTKPIDFLDLVDTVDKFEHDSKDVPNVIKCNKKTYSDLREYFFNLEKNEATTLEKPKYPPKVFFESIYGIKIVIDEDVEAGVLKFEKIIPTGC